MTLFDRRDLHAAVLHAVGNATAYRVGYLAPPNSILHEAVRAFESDDFLGGLLLESTHRHAETRLIARRELVALRRQKMVSCTKNGWSLTLRGLPHAISCRSRFMKKGMGNVTSVWICATLGKKELEKLYADMSRRCKHSAKIGETKDLVHNYISKLIARDGLLSLISQNDPPTISALSAWAYRASLSQFRDEGRDVLTRHFKGALTEIDLASPTRSVFIPPPVDTYKASYDRSTDKQEAVMMSTGDNIPTVTDIAGNDGRVDLEDAIARDQGLRRMVAALRRNSNEAQERFTRILGLYSEGNTNAEMARSEEMPRNRMASLMAEMRVGLHVSADQYKERMLNALQYVNEEPWATPDDVRDDVPDMTIDIVHRLVGLNLLNLHSGSLTLTSKGETVLISREFGHLLGGQMTDLVENLAV